MNELDVCIAVTARSVEYIKIVALLKAFCTELFNTELWTRFSSTS